MTRGFVTIATGDDRYYRMARNLLRSYRQNCSQPVPFAIIADKRNKYTEEFDDVVILDNPTYSWMDKMRLLDACPYDENLFIDADCLVYEDINYYWDLFADADDFSCFGNTLPLDAKNGWFTKEAAQHYPIQFCVHLHGMLYYIRKSETLLRLREQCNEIIKNYGNVRFKGFNDRLADEPIYALAMAILGVKPVERKPAYYCFVPSSTQFRSDYLHRTVFSENPKDGEVTGHSIVHWGNRNTLRAAYRKDAWIVNHNGTNTVGYRLWYRTGLLLAMYKLRDSLADFGWWIYWRFRGVVNKIKKGKGR